MTPHSPPRYKLTTSEVLIYKNRISDFLIIRLNFQVLASVGSGKV